MFEFTLKPDSKEKHYDGLCACQIVANEVSPVLDLDEVCQGQYRRYFGEVVVENVFHLWLPVCYQ